MNPELEESGKLQLDFTKLQRVVKSGYDVLPVVVQDAESKEVIIVAYAKTGDGSFVGGAKLSGSGLYTRGRKAAVFSTLQFYRLVGSPAQLVLPIAPEGERSIGDVPNAQLPKSLDDLPPRYLVPIYEPLRTLVQNKVFGLVSLPRKLGY